MEIKKVVFCSSDENTPFKNNKYDISNKSLIKKLQITAFPKCY